MKMKIPKRKIFFVILFERVILLGKKRKTSRDDGLARNNFYFWLLLQGTRNLFI